MRTSATLLLAVLVGWAGAAAGQGPPACSADVQRFCAGVQPGSGRIAQCLRQHADELSPDCKQALGGRGRGGGRPMARGNPWIKDCEADAAKLCPGVQPGGGRIHACLLGNAGELSPACRTALENRPRRAGAASPAPTPAAP